MTVLCLAHTAILKAKKILVKLTKDSVPTSTVICITNDKTTPLHALFLLQKLHYIGMALFSRC